MSLVGGPFYAGDVGFELLMPFVMPTGVSGLDAVTARLMVTTPGNASTEWPVNIAAASSTQITVRHVTDGTTNATAGDYRVRAFVYDADDELIATSKVERLTVTANPVALPT